MTALPSYPLSDLVTVRMAADHLGLSFHTVREYEKQRWFPDPLIADGTTRIYSLAEIRRAMADAPSRQGAFGKPRPTRRTA
jgi:hypothetical protein